MEALYTMKTLMKKWKNYILETKDVNVNFLSVGDKLTDKGISLVFDEMLRGKYYEAYQILYNDGKGFLDKPINNLLRKYWKFAMKFKKIDGRFVPPQVWLDDLKNGDRSFYRNWNKNN